MRFPIRFLFLAAAPVLIASAGQGPRGAHGGAMGVPHTAGRIGSPAGGRPYPVPPSVALQHPELRPHSAGFTGIRPGAYSQSGGYYYQRGRGGYLPYTYGLPYLPIFDYGDYGASQQNSAIADAVAAQAQNAAATQNLLGEQVQRLSAEVENLRDQAASQPAPAQQSSPTPQAQPAPDPDPAPPRPPITVVLKNGNRVQVQNYAVMGQTFWDFTTQPARKIPVSNINVPESINASSASGAEFPALTSSR
ncbi:MAG TPA: hypothetical protein VLJ11_03700 [Bryobacteraceae bacterium]|nr:hypothetical protein [Bryobacteraceae bacterium]